MDAAEVDVAIDELETRLERLRALYEQYFMGIERIEPTIARKDVDRRIYLLRREKIRNTAKRFKLQTIIQRYNTFQQYWQRICREIENGTYKRHLLRAQRNGELLTIAARKRLGRQARQSSRPPEGASPSQAPASPSQRPASPSQTPAPPSAPPQTAAPSAPPRPAATPGAPQASAAQPATSPSAPSPPQQTAAPSPPPPRPPLPSTPFAQPPQPATPRSAPLLPGALPRRPLSSRPELGPNAAASPPAAPPRAISPPTPAPPPRAAASSPPSKFESLDLDMDFMSDWDPGAVRDKRPQAPAARPAPAPEPKPAAASATTPTATRPAAPAAPKPAPPPTATRAAPTQPKPAPAPTQPKPAPAPTQPKPAPAPTQPKPAPSPEELRLRELHARLQQAKQQTNEPRVSFEGMVKSVRAAEAKLREQHKDRKIEFDVVIKDGKAIVKPILR